MERPGDKEALGIERSSKSIVRGSECENKDGRKSEIKSKISGLRRKEENGRFLNRRWEMGLRWPEEKTVGEARILESPGLPASQYNGF